MEKRVNNKSKEWMDTFKEKLRELILAGRTDGSIKSEKAADILQYVYAYPALKFSKEDISRRQRVKNIVPYHDRCHARRADHGQCTRRKKAAGKFCGTHAKGTPHGIIEDLNQENGLQKIDIWAQDIEGIISHMDKAGNIYDPQDIFQNVKNPRIIARYEKQSNGTYTLAH